MSLLTRVFIKSNTHENLRSLKDVRPLINSEHENVKYDSLYGLQSAGGFALALGNLHDQARTNGEPQRSRSVTLREKKIYTAGDEQVAMNK